MNKVVKIPLNIEAMDKKGTPVDYNKVCKLLHQIQDEVRTVKNKSIQYCWEWNNFQSEYTKIDGAKVNIGDVTKYKRIDGYIYDQLKTESNMYSGALTATIISACARFKNDSFEIKIGKKSVPEYKANQPIPLTSQSIKLTYNDNKFLLTIGLFNQKFAKENNVGTSLVFKAVVDKKKMNSQRTILERCSDKVYKICGSELEYHKGKWYLSLVYEFETQTSPTLDSNKILGVDLGKAKAVVASVYGDKDSFVIDGGEVDEMRRRIDSRKKSLQSQGKYCGEGRIGHGYKTRTKPINQIGDKVSRCRDTINHKYSKHLVDYAIKKGCGVIQIEDLSGIGKKNSFLQNWDYFDLQTKITNKAAEQGIEVVKIKPAYTSKRCSKCGYIHTDNRTEQAKFKCLNCGFEVNADYNASQNIAIRDIDKIISADIK